MDNSPQVGEGLEEGRNSQACRCSLNSCEGAQNQAEAPDDQVTHKGEEPRQPRAEPCLVVAASLLGVGEARGRCGSTFSP